MISRKIKNNFSSGVKAVLDFSKTEKDETNFILGIDIGNFSSSVSYFDIFQNSPEVIDASGGYGKTSFPTLARFCEDDNDWIFGEYAYLSEQTSWSYLFDDIVEKLEDDFPIKFNNQEFYPHEVLSLFLQDIINGAKNINPRAKIVGIIISVKDNMTQKAIANLGKAMKLTNHGEAFLHFEYESKCMLQNFLFRNGVEILKQRSKLVILDFSDREFTGFIFGIDDEKSFRVERVRAEKLINAKLITEGLNNYFVDIYCEKVQKEREQLSKEEFDLIFQFTISHKDIIFQKSSWEKPLKLYFNGLFPPFEIVFEKKEFDLFVLNYVESIKSFLIGLHAEDNQSFTVICVGGGFEMLFLREAVTRFYDSVGENKVIFPRDTKSYASKGACLIAANVVKMFETNDVKVINDLIVRERIGIMASDVFGDEEDGFVTLIKENSYVKQVAKPIEFIARASTKEPIKLVFYARDNGETKKIDEVEINIGEERPELCTRLRVDAIFESENNLKVRISDLGFGEIFKSTGEVFEKSISLRR